MPDKSRPGPDSRPGPYIKFLGTGGARFVVARQLRASGGTYVTDGTVRIMVDPGPGTLVRAAKSRPPLDVTNLDGILLTHLHIDHSNDVNVLIDALTDGGLRRRGYLFAPRECLEGPDAVVLRYVRPFLRDVVALEPETDYQIEGLSFSTSIPHRHGQDHDVETYGLKLCLGGQTVSFVVDTGYFDELCTSYAGSDVLIMNVVRYAPAGGPANAPGIRHLSSDDAERLLACVRPRQGVLTHFGMTMLRAKPWMVAQQMSERLGIPVIAATDGMIVSLGDEAP